MAHPLPRACRGFTLVEAMAVFAVIAIAAGVALPAYRSQLLHARRADAVNALQQLQQAQEQYRQDQGHYAADLATLRRAERSREGLYTLALAEVGADRYTAIARHWSAVLGRKRLHIQRNPYPMACQIPVQQSQAAV